MPLIGGGMIGVSCVSIDKARSVSFDEVEPVEGRRTDAPSFFAASLDVTPMERILVGRER